DAAYRGRTLPPFFSTGGLRRLEEFGPALPYAGAGLGGILFAYPAYEPGRRDGSGIYPHRMRQGTIAAACDGHARDGQRDPAAGNPRRTRFRWPAIRRGSD